MTKDMGSVVSRELRDRIPSTTITADAIVRAGKRRVLGRRLGFAGAFVTGIAALTAGILVLQPIGGALPSASPSASSSSGLDESPAPPPQEVQPSFPLPDLDWNEPYDWNFDSALETETAETVILTERLWQWIAGRGDIELFYFDEFTGETEPITRANFPAIVRAPQNLVEDLEPDPGTFKLGPPTGYRRPLYVLDSGPGIATHVRWSFDEADNDAMIGVAFYPKDSYLPGAKSTEASPGNYDVRHLVAGCEDYRYTGQGGAGEDLADFTCAETAGPDGERILTVECVLNADSEYSVKTITVVVYRPDGNAVVVDGSPISEEGAAHHKGQGPILTGADLADLALSLPDLVIK